MGSEINRRKAEHIDLCVTDQVAFRERTTLLEEVRLMHQCLPDFDLRSIDLRTTLCGKQLQAPLVISAMTGGTERAAQINQDLAKVVHARGLALGLGSQRAMQRNPESAFTYHVREYAPDALVLGNMGVIQARDLPTGEINRLLREIGADAICVHMNPAMELIQTEGDRDFSQGTQTFQRLVAELDVPVIAKETGCGISPTAAAKLVQAGVQIVDVSGAGGTSWVGVETLRAAGRSQRLGEQLWDWGIPTAASVVYTTRRGLTTIATGGVRSGLDIARALALGASAAGMAQPLLRALVEGGVDAACRLVDDILDELRTVMLLCGAASVAELHKVPRILGPELQRWLSE